MFVWRNAALVNRTRRVGSNTLLPFPEIVVDSGGSVFLWYTTQLSHTFHNSNCTFVFRVWSSGSSPAYRHVFWGAPRDDHFSTRLAFLTERGPSASHRHHFSAHDHGRLRSSKVASALVYLLLRRPDCTLSRVVALSAEENDRPVTWSIATPEPGCPGPHRRSSRSSPRPWVCHHTREPTVLFRVRCRPLHLNIDRFHQHCLLPGRTSRRSEDCHPRTTWRPLTLFGQPGTSSFASHWRFLPRRLDGTTAGR